MDVNFLSFFLSFFLDTYGEKYWHYYEYRYKSLDDNTASFSSEQFSIVNRPTKPTLVSPKNNTKLEYPWNQPSHNPKFSWKEPDSWGWAPGDNKKLFILNIVNKKAGSLITKTIEGSTSYELDESLSDGDYEWFVTAKLGNYEGLPSEKRNFSVCTINEIGDISLTYPENNAYIPEKNVKFTWEEPDFGSSCADSSLYKYKVTVNRKGVYHHSTEIDRGTTSVNITLPDEDVYSWEIKAIGPLEISSNIAKNEFTVCTKKEPESPVDLQTDMGSVSSCKDENLTYKFTWNKTLNVGKNCREPVESISVNYTLQICDNASKCENVTTSEDTYSKSILCSSMTYTASVWAYNGYADSKPDTMSFSVCKQTAPEAPEIGEIETTHCQTTTEIRWNHSNWGDRCTELGSDNYFLVFKKEDNTTKFDKVPYQENGTYVYLFADKGKWEVIIYAESRNGLRSPNVSKTFNASEIPNPTDLKGTFHGDNKAVLSWKSDSDFVKCGGPSTYNYILNYTCNGTTKSETLATNETNFAINASGVVEWQISVVKDNEIIDTVYNDFNTDDTCIPRNPRWNDPSKVLVSPTGDNPVFESINFKWNGAIPGRVCENETKNETQNEGLTRRDTTEGSELHEGYRILVTHENKIWTEETANTELTMTIDAYGIISWNVTAFIGDLPSETTGTKTFCHEEFPPTPTIHKYNPYEPNTVSWESAESKI